MESTILDIVAAVASALAAIPLPVWLAKLIGAASTVAIVAKFIVGVWERFKHPPAWVYSVLKAIDLFAANSKAKVAPPKP